MFIRAIHVLCPESHVCIATTRIQHVHVVDAGVFEHARVRVRHRRAGTGPRDPIHHNWNVATNVPCHGHGETKCEVWPCLNALYPEKTEVRQTLWLPQEAPREGQGVFARCHVEEGTFVLDFGDLRLASKKEMSGGWLGWCLTFEVETALSRARQVFVVVDGSGVVGDNRLVVPTGGKVNSTCCKVHMNAELVPDSAATRMYVRTTKWVRADSEILVMFRPDGGFFRGMQGRCRCCACEQRTPACYM